MGSVLKVTLLACALSARVVAAESPVTCFSVVCDADARPWERTAVRELGDYLGRLAQDGDVRLGGKSGVVFHVGDTAFAREHGMLLSAFEDEAWAVRSFGTDVVVNGGGTRGCLYAAYNFLENACGVRWWADGEEDVPGPRRLTFDGLDMKGRPFFAFRAIFRTARATDPLTAVRNRVNYEPAIRDRADLGGAANFAPPYFCHNWNQVLPFAKFGKDHPEWYSLRNGKRVGGAYEGQLCTTCPTLPAAFAAEVEKHLADGAAAAAKSGLPPPKYFDISMNDNRLFCTCPACAAETERCGHSGRQLRFENQVATLVGAKHPDVKFTVFSYYHSEPAPLDETCAADNVIVRVCDTRGNLAAPVSDPTNGFMRKQIRDWARHAKELFVWDYMITFFRPETFDFPLPSELHYGEKFRFYAENSVRGLFLEQERPDTADLHAVKYWMEAKLMENPYLDADRLFREAMHGYYGPAAEELIVIRRDLSRLCADYGGSVTYEPLVAAWNWLSDEAVARFLSKLDAVERKVAADAKILRRVRRFRHAFDAVKDLRSEFGGLKPPEKGVSDKPFFDFLPNPRVFTVSARATNRIESVSDPAAFAGRAMRMDNADGTHSEFSLPFEWGYYDQTGEKTYKSVIKEATGPGYNWYDLQEIDFPEHSGFLYFNSNWSMQMNVAAPLVKGKVRVRLHAKFENGETRIDRVVIIPLDGV